MEEAVCHIGAEQHMGGASRAAAHAELGGEADGKSYSNQVFPVVRALSNKVDFILGGSTLAPWTL